MNGIRKAFMKIRFDILRNLAALLAVVAGLVLPPLSHAGTITYYHNDLLGSPVAATDASGHVIWRESYRPYGERLTNDPASTGSDVWYTSRRQDADTGLVYMGARYYDPVVGRFVSKDPAGFDEKNIQSFNRYSYANDNPYRFVDTSGRESMATLTQERMQREYLKGNISEEQLFDLYKAQAAGGAIGLAVMAGAAPAIETIGTGASLSAAEQLAVNRAAGAAFEEFVGEGLAQRGLTVGEQITVDTQSGIRTRLDFLTRDPITGEIGCVECKASASARLTPGQLRGFPEIEQSGGTIAGAGKPGFPGGTEIPPTKVQVIRGP